MVPGFTVLRISALALACTALAGCLGSSGSVATGPGGAGGGGGSTTVAEFEAAYDRVTDLTPTADMPTTGTASYQGEVLGDIHAGTVQVGTLLADVQFEIDFAAANTDRTRGVIGGTIDNFRGEFQGEEISLQDNLTVAKAAADGYVSTAEITTITADDMPDDVINALPPGVTIPDTRTGSVGINFAGTLTDDDGKSYDIVTELGGGFFGSNAAAANGPAVGGLVEVGGNDQMTFGGTWYANRQ